MPHFVFEIRNTADSFDNNKITFRNHHLQRGRFFMSKGINKILNGDEQRLTAKYSSFLKLLKKLSDQEVEDVYLIIKQ